jgi:ubiquinone biosynthesis protein Coq4
MYEKYYLSWAIETGKNTEPLLNVYWEKRWNQDVDDLRKELNIVPLIIPETA